MTEYYRHYWSEQGYNPRRFGTPDDLRKLYEVYATSETDCVDIGCGDGGTSGLLLDQRANSYVGVDLSPTAVELATGRGLDARVIEDAAKLPFGDDSFDLAVCIEVLEHMYEPHLAVREVMRVLRPGGRLIATVPNAAHWRDRVDMLLGIWQPRGDDRGRSEPWRSPHVRFFRPATLERMLHQAGFAEVDVSGRVSPIFERVPGLQHRNAGPISRRVVRVAPTFFAGGLLAIATRAE